ncbi:MAG: hypothetical protein FWG23_05235 [Eggerthellaceae bacterium]|jgi:hypothetical protein|nr:hypothetical protein [Eggerthellaceae bacterium]MDR2715460.1 hypothetical protein [Coriobacteriaceae bacterium]
MVNEETLKLQNSVMRMEKTCRIIKTLCLICLAGFVLVWSLVVCFFVVECVQAGFAPLNLVDIVFFIMFGVLVCLSLIIAIRAFSDVIAGESPFTLKQAKRLRTLGTVFLLLAVAEALLSVLFGPLSYGAELPGGGLIGLVTVESSMISVNLSMLIVAVMCYGFAVIFKYGILLQQLSDDTA